ncbi:hypothetical protein FRB99_006388 [Tulasnella sp. 403]|nr:hypothetical protein FRB99_006388 [Tulasnella sp. 403]
MANEAFDVALIQLGGVTRSKEDNLRHAREMVRKAARAEGREVKPRLVVLPECFNSPYGVKYFPEYAERIGFVKGEEYDVEKSESGSVRMLSEVAKEVGVWLIGGSIPERDVSDDAKLYNTATVYNPNGNHPLSYHTTHYSSQLMGCFTRKGELVAIHRKTHLFDIDIPGKITFQESKVLTGGDALTHIDTDVGKLGLGICYDVRFPEPAMIAARRGCIAMIYPGAFNLTTGPLHWELLARARAVDNQIYVAMCSPARDMSADYNAWGHSMVVDPLANKLVEADEHESIIYATIQPQAIAEARKNIPVSSQRRFDVYPDIAALAAHRD